MELKDVLHFYLGQKFRRTMYYASDTSALHSVTDFDLDPMYLLDWNEPPSLNIGKVEDKLMLRPLSSMTEEEEKAMIATQDDVKLDGYPKILLKVDSGETFAYMISKGFDLFGLIDKGLAIDASKL